MSTKHVVLGSSGFLGSHMLAFLKEKSFDVVGVHGVDLRNIDNVRNALMGADIVYHFAADMGGVGYFSEANYYPFINNMLIDLNVLRVTEEIGVSRLFYPSSACVYPPSKEPLTESMIDLPAEPDQMYGWEKLSITRLAKYSPVDVRVGILHTIFGPGQTWIGKKAKFPPTIVYKSLMARKTNQIEIWGDGKQTRTFLYIDDALEKIYSITSSDSYNGPVNVSSNETVTIQECADWICNYLNIKPKFTYLLDKPTGVLSRGIDNSKFYSLYNIKEKYTTKRGFELLTDWLRLQIDS